MPSRFHTMKCAASELFTTSTAWMLLAYSCPMRWKIRSPPDRSTRRSMPGYFASNALPRRSATGRSTAVYQTTLPSFFAASINSGVTLVGAGGATARAAPTGAVTARQSTSRAGVLSRRILPECIVTPLLGSRAERPAAVRWKSQPYGSARRETAVRRGDDPQLGSVSNLDEIVARVAQEDVADDRAVDRVRRGRAGGMAAHGNVVLPDADGHLRAGRERR